MNVEWASKNLALGGEGLNGETIRHREANVRPERELLGA